MATKTFCDVCNREAKVHRISYLCHLDPARSVDVRGYVDRDGNPTSGRELTAELCIKCYNRIVGRMVQQINSQEADVKRAIQEAPLPPVLQEHTEVAMLKTAADIQKWVDLVQGYGHFRSGQDGHRALEAIAEGAKFLQGELSKIHHANHKYRVGGQPTPSAGQKIANMT